MPRTNKQDAPADSGDQPDAAAATDSPDTAEAVVSAPAPEPADVDAQPAPVTAPDETTASDEPDPSATAPLPAFLPSAPVAPGPTRDADGQLVEPEQTDPHVEVTLGDGDVQQYLPAWVLAPQNDAATAAWTPPTLKPASAEDAASSDDSEGGK